MINLTSDNLETVITGKSKGKFLVKFFTPWCGSCKIFQPVLENAAKALNLDIYEYNCDLASSAYESLNIQTVPTVIFFQDGKEMVRFTGITTMKTMVDAIKPMI